jgi:selenocysteine-specific elongation factor
MDGEQHRVSGSTATSTAGGGGGSGERPVVVNVGILGHVDSGKTSLCAAVSDILSTAALDKNPQSQERGITMDLQFSAITLQHASSTQGPPLVFTLVDCPGHASLIRTIVGGS